MLVHVHASTWRALLIPQIRSNINPSPAQPGEHSVRDGGLVPRPLLSPLRSSGEWVPLDGASKVAGRCWRRELAAGAPGAPGSD